MMQKPAVAFVVILVSAFLLTVCADTNDAQVCVSGTFQCQGVIAMRCASNGGGWEVENDCALLGKQCTSRGCAVCEPGAATCHGADLLQCNHDGTAFLDRPLLSCDASKGEMCDDHGCANACAKAKASRSYVGCEYWAVDLDNAVVESGSAAAQQFAVVVSNPSALPATVRVTINEAPLGQPPQIKEVTVRDVLPDKLEVILLDSREVDGSPSGEFNTGSHTALSANAYKIESSAPIIAYQFNPLSNVGVFSNDASLLIPAPALSLDIDSNEGASYLVMGWPQTIAKTEESTTNFGVNLRSFLTVVGTREETDVRITLTADIVGDANNVIGPKKKGEEIRLRLAPYEVLNLETGYFAADFTGTRIDATKPVAVFSGSEAADVPDFPDLSQRRCCADHLEEQLFPVPTLGTTFFALVTPPRSEALKNAGATITVHPERDFFRILSTGEFSSVSTNLPAPLDKLDINAGQFVQFAAAQDFVIQARDPVVVGQFMTSQEDAAIPSTLPGGDPSFILLPPLEQFRNEYLFLTPDKYSFDYILVAAPSGAEVRLDGRLLKEGCDQKSGAKLCCTRNVIGKVRRTNETHDTQYEAYKCQLSFPLIKQGQIPPQNLEAGEQNDGVHRLLATAPVGLIVCGFDAFVSYGYPGGTALTLINIK